jgi:hypothetical protein
LFLEESNPDMLDRILFILERVFISVTTRPVFFKLSIVLVYSKLLKKQYLHQPVKVFVHEFIGAFMQKLYDYPLLVMEVLFAKSTYDCKYIDLGDDPLLTADDDIR